MTWLALRNSIDLDDEKALSKLAVEAKIGIASQAHRGYSSVLVNGFDVTDGIHTSKLQRIVSCIPRVPGVRQALVAKQHSMAEEDRMVMAGRDIGTVVLPEAELKLFLVASLEERDHRGYEHHPAENGGMTCEDVPGEGA